MTTPKAPYVITRRKALQAAAALAGAGVLGSFPTRAQAKGKIVLSTWGGDYSNLLTKNISSPILTPQGWQVVNDEAGAPQRKTKTIAEKRLPKGTSDIQAFAATDVPELVQAETLEKIDLSKLKNARNLIKTFSIADSPYFSPHIYSGKVVLYNPKLINPAPTGIADLWNPKNQGKVGVVDIQFVYTTMAAALMAGGKTGDFDKAKQALLELKKLKPRIYPTNEALAQGLMTEECGLCIMWKARAVQWQNAGISVESVAPAEGLPMYVSGFSIPKNAPNKDGAYAYMNAMLDKGAQENFAIDMGYNPTVTGATVAPDLQKRIGFTPEEQKRLIDLDYGYIAKNDAALKEWWDKVFKA